MNRFKALLIMSLLILVFTGCEKNDSKDIISPTFGPLVNRTIDFGDAFDPMDGVAATDETDGDITLDAECTIFDSYGEEAFDSNVTDVYTQTCTVSDTAGNTGSVERTITVLDEFVGAVISGVVDTTTGYGKYFDLTANLEIIDKLDGNITEDVEIKIYYTDPLEQVESLDTNQMRSYYVDYIILNSLDIETELRITVDVVDDTGPVIDAENFVLDNMSHYNLLDGITANDEFYGIITEIEYTLYDNSYNEVEYAGKLYGEFIIEYSAVDPLGNVGTKEVSLTIQDVYLPEVTVESYYLNILPGDIVDLNSNVISTDESDDVLTTEIIIYSVDTSESVASITNTDYGFYRANVIVRDAGGQRGETEFYITVTNGNLENADLQNFSAETRLDSFLKNARFSFISDEFICKLYVTDALFDVGISYEECISGMANIASKTSSATFSGTTSEIIGGIKYYTTDVTFTRPDEFVERTITYHFMNYEYSLYNYIVFDTDPFDVEYPISVYNPEFSSVDNQLLTFYGAMLNPTIPVQTFCQLYVVDAIHNTMTLNDCIDYVEEARESILDIEIVSYEEKTILLDAVGPVPGYEADIEITKAGVYVQTVTVQFAFFEQSINESLLFIDGFFGPDYNPELNFTNDPPAGIQAEVTEFYDALLSTTLSATEFCEIHYMISPVFDIDLDHCVSYVESIRDENVTYSIGMINSIMIDAFNGELIGYTLNITFVDNAIDQELVIDFAIMEKEDGYYPIFFDLYLVNLNNDEEINFAVIGSRMLPGVISRFYEEVVDESMSCNTFCAKYLLTGGGHDIPLTYLECSGIRLDLNKDSYNFEVVEIEYQDSKNPPVYLVDMKRNTFTEYEIEFTMYYDPLGGLVIRVNLNDALGGGFE